MLAIFVLAAFTSLTAPAMAQDVMASSAAYRELQEICAEDRGRLWGVDLCGPTIIVDPATRAAWASESDSLGVFTNTGAGWVGTLPADAPLANTAVEWAARRWIMLLSPLPTDQTDRRVLLAHEAWHRAQPQLGFASTNAANAHLDQERARVLLRLEFRALATALRSRGRARDNAAREALLFRSARHVAFPGAAAEEAMLDRNEGLAAYTGVRLGAGENTDLYAARILDEFDNHEAYSRAFAYANGPAYGLLLDRAQPNWRSEIGPNTPANLLAAILRPRTEDRRRLTEATARYGGAEVAAAERSRAQSMAARLADLRRLYAESPRLELPLIAMRMEFNPNQITAIPGLGSFYGTLTIRDSWGELRTTEGAVIASDYQRVIAASPDASGLTGPGWVLTLTPGYQLAPAADGVIRVIPVADADRTR